MSPRLPVLALFLLTLPGLVSAAEKGVRPDSALELLLAGNQYFVNGRPLRPDQTPARRAELVHGQKPFAVVLTCADSRVAPEIFFDQGLGDLFVLRNAGNVVDDHVIGSIEYAVEHLGTGLVIVVGHAKCGAVSAAVAGGHAPGHIDSIIESIRPAVELVEEESGDKVDNAVRANARRAAALLEQSGPILNEAVAKGTLKVMAARYDLASGKVELLEPLKQATAAGETVGAAHAEHAAGAPAEEKAPVPHAAPGHD